MTKIHFLIKDVGGHNPIAVVSGVNGRDYHFVWEPTRAAHVRTYDLGNPEDVARFEFEQAEILTHRGPWPITVAAEVDGGVTDAPSTSEELHPFLKGHPIRLIHNFQDGPDYEATADRELKMPTIGIGIAFMLGGELARIAVEMPRNPSEEDLKEAWQLLSRAVENPKESAAIGDVELTDKAIKVPSLLARKPARAAVGEGTSKDVTATIDKITLETTETPAPAPEPTVPAADTSDDINSSAGASDAPPAAAPTPLEELTENELRARAKEAGVKGYSQMKREKLIAKLTPTAAE